MARLITQIQTQMTQYYVAAMASIGITIDPTKWSRRNKQQATINAFSEATAVLEQNFDAFVSDTEALISIAAPQTAPWIQNLCINVFQYDAADPQVPRLDISGDTFAVYYPVPDATKRIVTQCVVVNGTLGNAIVKVAKGGTTPVPLTSGTTSELSALQSLLNLSLIPGQNVNAQTYDSDKVYIGAIATYTGSYSAIIQSTLVAAIEAFLQSIPTSGIAAANSSVGLMRLTDLIAAAKGVPGMVDFELVNVNARQDVVPFVSGTYNLVTGSDWIATGWNSGLNGAGYMATETTATYTINDSITYIPV
jgi:hypothetical protein